MGPHVTWFDLTPGMAGFRESLQGSLGRTWTWQVFQTTHFEITHVLVALVVFLLLVLGAASYRSSVVKLGEEAILPSPRFNLRAVFESLADIVFGMLEGVMGEKNARKYLPFLGSFFIFVLFSNLISLVPGFRAPTDTLKTNIGLAYVSKGNEIYGTAVEIEIHGRLTKAEIVPRPFVPLQHKKAISKRTI